MGEEEPYSSETEGANVSPASYAQLARELEAARQNERRLQAFLEFAAQGVVAVDERGRIVLVNVKTEEMFGYTREELLGRPLEILLPPRFRRAHEGHRGEYFAHPRTRPMGLGMDLAGLRKDGSEFPVEISLSYVNEAGSRVALGFITDITERKRAEEQLRHTQKLESLGVLAGGVAHDFNNLLTGVMGNASLALDALNPAHPARMFLESILTSSQRAADLTQQLLAYAGKGRFVVSPIDLTVVVREICDLIRASIPKSVDLRLGLAEKLPPFEGDASQIQQLVMNLVINAAEAIPEGTSGSVSVVTRAQQVDEGLLRSLRAEAAVAPGEYVCLEVNDTGCGMDEATEARMFDPFFTTKFTGRGLGLAAVSGIVRGHRGALKVYSAPGRGTSFKVLFPAAVRDWTASPAKTGVELAGSGLVLVVDDENVVRQTARAALERYGYSVLTAEDGQSGVEIYREMAHRVSVVLLDLTMPGISGEETLRRLQAVKPDVRVVLSSGYHQSEAVRRFPGRGLAGFIQKPYTAAQLAERIKAALQ